MNKTMVWKNSTEAFNQSSATSKNATRHEDINGSPIPFGITVMMWFMYMGVTVVSVIGNGLVCYIVLAFKRIRTVTNIFIVNLAVGDVMMATLCIPFTFISNLILGYWPFGEIMCPLVMYAQAVMVFTSAYTLVAISIDRYVAILYPLKPRLTKFYAKAAIGVVWLVALSTPIPTAVTSSLIPHPHWANSTEKKYICQEIWHKPLEKYGYSLALMTLQFFFPLVVLVFTYLRIAVVVWGKKTPGEAEDIRDQKLARAKRKMVAMMIVVVTVFTGCWLPFNVLITVGDQDPSIWLYPQIRYIWFSFHWLAMSHTCYNPIIYCWLNAKFREGFRQLFQRAPCCGLKCRTYKNDLRRCGTVTTTYSSVKRVNVHSCAVTNGARSPKIFKDNFKWNRGRNKDPNSGLGSNSVIKYNHRMDDDESQV